MMRARDGEEWRLVVTDPPANHEDRYEVSNLGNVRRWYDTSERINDLYSDGGVFPIELRPQKGGTIVGLELGKNTRRYLKTTIARLVLTAFVRPSVAGEVAEHIDHDGANNVVANLRWRMTRVKPREEAQP